MGDIYKVLSTRTMPRRKEVTEESIVLILVTSQTFRVEVVVI
jgi:hypothetical protein